MTLFDFLIEPPHDKTSKMICAPSKDSDQPGHPPSLTRVFAVHMKKHWVLSYPLRARQRLGSDWADTRLIWVFAGRTSHFVGFVMQRLIYFMFHFVDCQCLQCIPTSVTLSFQTDRSRQTVQTQIRLLLEEQSDQGLHCLQFPLHLLDALLWGNAILFNF